jgi:general secretion pathway protein M
MNAPAFWRSRSVRERRVMGVGGALVALLLFVVLVWLPVARSHARLEREMPAMRASLDSLQRQADEVRRLRTLPPVGTTSASQSATPPLPGAQVTIPSPGRLRVVATDVPFSALLDWITAVEAAQGLRVDSARVESLPAPGRVRADVTLERT